MTQTTDQDTGSGPVPDLKSTEFFVGDSEEVVARMRFEDGTSPERKQEIVEEFTQDLRALAEKLGIGPVELVSVTHQEDQDAS